MSAKLRINLLGPIYVEWEGAPINISDFGSRKDLALFCYLVTEGLPLSRHYLASLFWHDKNERLGLNNLNRVLSQLRKLLPGCVQSDQYYIAFEPEIPVWSDVNAFVELEAERSVESLAMAVSLYQGEFMAGFLLDSGFEFESWLTVQREKWVEKTAVLLRQLMDHYTHIENDQQEQGLEYASKLLEIQPWRESAHRRKMRMLARVQRFSAALMQYEICKRILAQELNVEPSRKTVDLYERIKTARHQVSQKLPIALTPFVGREAEIAMISTLLAKHHCRLLTITGPGGIGKSRIALAIAHGKMGLFLNGTFFISLAQIADSKQLPEILAETFEITIPKNIPTAEAVLAYLKDKEILLILDDFDHVLDSQGLRFIIEMLTTATRLKIILTSRQRLKLTGEYVVEIQGLTLPPHNAGLEPETLKDKSKAVALFLEIARNVQTDFSPSAGEMADIIQICRLLSGMPLAIEMAASWVRTSSCRQIATSLRKGILFIDNAGHLEASQLSVKAAFDYSWNRLNPEEQAAFRRLSIFRGGFQREAAQVVGGTSLSVLSKLVDNSLLHWDPESKRYEIHELLRQYAAQKLAAIPAEQEEIEILHSKYYGEYVRRRDISLGRDLINNRNQIRQEINNIRLGWKHAFQHEQVDLIGQTINGLWGYYETAGNFAEAMQAFDVIPRNWTVSEQALSDHQRFLAGQIMARQGWFSCRMGHFVDVQNLASKSLSYMVEAGATPGYQQFGWPHYLMGISSWYLGNYQLAEKWLAESLADFRHYNDQLGVSLALHYLGVLYESLGNFEKAQQYLKENIQLAKANANERSYWLNTALLGKVAFGQGDCETAERNLNDACSYFESMRDNYAQATCYGLQGTIHYLKGDFQPAHQIVRQALDLIRSSSDPWLEAKFRLQLGNTINAMPSISGATQLFTEALELASQIHALPLILATLAGFAMLPQFRTAEHNREVSGLLEFILRHSAVSYETQNEAKRLLAQSDLPARSEPELAKSFLLKEFGPEFDYLFAGITQ